MGPAGGRMPRRNTGAGTRVQCDPRCPWPHAPGRWTTRRTEQRHRLELARADRERRAARSRSPSERAASPVPRSPSADPLPALPHCGPDNDGLRLNDSDSGSDTSSSSETNADSSCEDYSADLREDRLPHHTNQRLFNQHLLVTDHSTLPLAAATAVTAVTAVTAAATAARAAAAPAAAAATKVHANII